MFRSLTLASAAALLGVAAPAFAQPAADAWTWTGPYVGVNIGYGGGDFHYPFSGTTDAAGTNPVSGKARQSSTGVLGGGQAGYNYQMPNGWVLGLETDIAAADIGGNSSFFSATAAGNSTAGGVNSKINYLGTLRGRVGKPIFDGRFMPYVTGGFAYGGVRNSANFTCTSCATSAGLSTGAQTQTGWTVGAGTEYALDRHMSFKVEYLYTDLGSRDLTGGGVFNAPGVSLFNADVRENTNANVVRAGLNYRF